MTPDRYLLIRNNPLRLVGDFELMVPMSHEFGSRGEAYTWMIGRHLQALCKIVTKSWLDYRNPTKNLSAWITRWDCERPPAARKFSVVEGGKCGKTT